MVGQIHSKFKSIIIIILDATTTLWSYQVTHVVDHCTWVGGKLSQGHSRQNLIPKINIYLIIQYNIKSNHEKLFWKKK